VRVTPQAERALLGGHPWLFDQAVLDQSHEGKPGDLSVVFDKKRKFLAVGLYDPFSPIRVRILAHRHPTRIDSLFFKGRLLKAEEVRSSLPDDTTGFRLVHGGSDSLPGLVIDVYDRTLVLKLYSAAWVPHLNDMLPHLNEIHPYDRVILRFSREAAKHPEHLYGLADGSYLYGGRAEAPILFLENGLYFEADPIAGHKTGFYLDQRDNRARVGEVSAGKSVLNAFAYTGGFSVYAARGGARSVTSLDISAPALKAAVRNFAHNLDHPNVTACSHVTRQGDVFKTLTEFIDQGKKFDIVIIDPPSFAKKKSEISRAVAAYKRLTHLGLEVLQLGGTLVQASCSSRVDSETFFSAVHTAARADGRLLQEIQRTAHPIDHPIGFKESAYLKCLFAAA